MRERVGRDEGKNAYKKTFGVHIFNKAVDRVTKGKNAHKKTFCVHIFNKAVDRVLAARRFPSLTEGLPDSFPTGNQNERPVLPRLIDTKLLQTRPKETTIVSGLARKMVDRSNLR